MRIGRGYPQQSFTVQGQALGPRDPAVDTFPLAVVTTPGQLRVATHLAAVGRVQAGYQRRAPHSQLFGFIGPVPPPVETTVVAIFAARGRESLHRFPLQGWLGASGTQARYPYVKHVPLGGGAQGFGNAAPNSVKFAERFSTSATLVSTVSVALATSGAPTDSAQISIQADAAGVPSGVVLASATIPAASLASSFSIYTLSLPVALTDGIYWLVLERTGTLSNLDVYSCRNVSPGISNTAKSFNGTVWGAFGNSLYFVLTPVAQLALSGFKRNLGVFPPAVVGFAPTSDELVIRATGVAVGSRRLTDSRRFPLQGWEGASSFLTDGTDGPEMAARNLGPRPPLVVDPSTPSAPPVVATLAMLSTAVVQRAQLQRHEPKSLLFPPATLAQPPPVVTKLLVHFVPQPRQTRPTTLNFVGPTVIAVAQEPSQLVQTIQATSVFERPPRTRSKLSAPAVVGTAVFVAAPIKVALAGGRRPYVHPRFVGSVVVFARPLAPPIEVALAHRVPLRRVKSLLPPIVVAATTFVAPPVHVNLQENQIRGFGRRFPTSVLSRPQALQVFTSGRPAFVGARPRPTTLLLAAPIVVRIPSVEQREQTIGVALTHARPRSTSHLIFAPVTAARAVVLVPIRVALARTRPRSTIKVIFPPEALQVFTGSKVSLVEVRPRPTAAVVGLPQVVRVPSVEQVEQTIRVSLARIRPRLTERFLSEPSALQVFSGPKVALARIEPRPVVHELGVPVAASAAVLVPVRVQLVQTRPRRVARFLGLPTFLQTFQAKVFEFVQVRPRPTTKSLFEPTVVIPLPMLQMQTVRTQLVRILPRPTSKRLARPVVVSATAVNRQQQTLAVTLVAVRTRVEQQRHAGHSFIHAPTKVIPLPTLRMQTIGVFQPRIKPRPTTKKLSAPIRVIPAPMLRQQTIGVFQPRIKPRPTSKKLSAPTRVIPLPTLRMQTVQVALAKIRPRKTTSFLPEPTVVVAAFIAEPVVVALAHTRPRPTSRTLFEPAVVRVPSVEQGEQTIRVALVKTRPRPIASKVDVPTVLQVFQTGRFVLVETRPRPTVKELAAPAVVRQAPVLYPVRVTLTRVRPRPTVRLLGEPTVLRTFSTGRVALVRVRPRPTSKRLAPPTRLVVQSVFQTQQTVKTILVRTRPRPTSRKLSAPTRLLVQSVFQTQQTIRISLVQTRPRPTIGRLVAPTKLAVQSVFQVQQTVRVSLVQVRPRPTTTVLAAPTSVGNAFTVLGQQTIRVVLVVTRPRPTVLVLAAPAAIATTTRAVATLSATDPHLGETDASELTEATVSSDSAGTIAELSLGKATEGTVSESELTEAETEAT